LHECEKTSPEVNGNSHAKDTPCMEDAIPLLSTGKQRNKAVGTEDRQWNWPTLANTGGFQPLRQVA
jgi:hypothetical protein